jgi:uncharacterized protein YeaO (DUF488 family)
VPVRTKRVYDDPSPDDGYRVCVMRMWPRGVKKESVDAWEKDLGTPKDLIKQWKNDEVDWATFSKRYRAAMKEQAEKIEALARRAESETVTLLCGCKDADHCHRTILRELVEKADGGGAEG